MGKPIHWFEPQNYPTGCSPVSTSGRSVLVIENVVPPETVDKVVAELGHAHGTFHGGKGSFAGHHTVRNAAKPLGESATAQELAVQPLVLGACEATLRPYCKKICLGTCSNISVEAPATVAEPPASPQVLHRDDSMWGCTSWQWLPQTPEAGRPTFSVSCMWALSDFTEHNGATRFLPGSHKWPRVDVVYKSGGPELHMKTGGSTPLPEGVEDGRDTVQAAMPKGSVVLWAGGTLHGASSHAPRLTEGELPEGHGVRRGLLFIYNLGYLKVPLMPPAARTQARPHRPLTPCIRAPAPASAQPEHNFHWAMPNAVLKSFGQRLQDLVGLHVGNPAPTGSAEDPPAGPSTARGRPEARTAQDMDMDIWAASLACPVAWVACWSNIGRALRPERRRARVVHWPYAGPGPKLPRLAACIVCSRVSRPTRARRSGIHATVPRQARGQRRRGRRAVLKRPLLTSSSFPEAERRRVIRRSLIVPALFIVKRRAVQWPSSCRQPI